MPYYVYLILCENDSFYTGYTKSVRSRMRMHANGKGARYTKMHKPKELAYTEKFSSRADAMKREKRIKKLSHNQKLELARKYAQDAKKKRDSQDDEQT